MIPRSALRNGVLPLVRFNSTGAQSSAPSNGSNPIFLSELLKRIDTVTSNIKQKKDESKFKPKTTSSYNKKSKFGANNNDAKSSTPRPNNKNNNNNGNNNNNNQFARGANHPFRSNTFRPREPREPRDPNDPQQQSFQKRSNFYQNNNNNNNNSNNTNNNYSGDRESRPQRNFRRSDAAPRDDRPFTRERSAFPTSSSQGPRRDPVKRNRPARVNGREVVKKPAVAPPIESKTLSKPTSLNPTITGDTFLYGKLTSANHTLNSRLLSLTKETLIKSNYPYLVPSEILSQLSSSSQNKFIVQKNWNSEINEDQFKQRFSELVKGDIQPLTLTKSTNDNKTVNELSASALSKNPTITFEKKQLVYDVINGVKSVKDLVGKAVWNKK